MIEPLLLPSDQLLSRGTINTSAWQNGENAAGGFFQQTQNYGEN